MPLGIQGNNLFVSYSYYNSGYMTVVKSYDKTTSFTQSHFTGSSTVVNTTSPCPDGTAINAAGCYVGWAFSSTPMTYNSFNNSWSNVIQAASGGNKALHVFTPGGNKTSVTLVNWPKNSTRKHDAGNNLVYYCDLYSHKIYKRNVTTSVETEILPDMPFVPKCESKSIHYNSERNTLIIAVDYLGNSGLIEMPAP
jgi:hypothetical protein